MAAPLHSSVKPCGNEEMHTITEVKFLDGAVVIKYTREGESTDEVFFRREVFVRKIAYPELIQFVYDNLCLLVENAEEDLLDFKQDDN